MRTLFVGVEFSHDKKDPNAVLYKKTRFGPVRRWANDWVPRLVDGILRERVVLLMPQGFRFTKDRAPNANSKFYMAMEHAVQKYLPYKSKTDKLTQKTGATDGADQATTEGSTTEEVQAESKSVCD